MRDLPGGHRRRAAVLSAGLSVLLMAACARPASHEEKAARVGPPPGLEFVPPAAGSYELPVIQPGRRDSGAGMIVSEILAGTA